MVKFVLTLLIISFVVRYVVPAVLRFFVGAFVQKQARKFSEQGFDGSPFGPPPPRQPRQPEGQVHVDFIPPKDKPHKPQEFKGGEYVDFEEVK